MEIITNANFHSSSRKGLLIKFTLTHSFLVLFLAILLPLTVYGEDIPIPGYEHLSEGRKFYEQGLSFFNKKDYKKAIEYFEKAFQKNSHHEEVKKKLAISYNTLGYQSYKDKNYEKAKKEFEKAISFEPDHELANYNLACIYGLQGKYSEALPHLQKALRQNPSRRRKRIKEDSDLKGFRGSFYYKVLKLEIDHKPKYPKEQIFVGFHEVWDGHGIKRILFNLKYPGDKYTFDHGRRGFSWSEEVGGGSFSLGVVFINDTWHATIEDIFEYEKRGEPGMKKVGNNIKLKNVHEMGTYEDPASHWYKRRRWIFIDVPKKSPEWRFGGKFMEPKFDIEKLLNDLKFEISVEPANIDETRAWETYRDDEIGFELKYPKLLAATSNSNGVLLDQRVKVNNIPSPCDESGEAPALSEFIVFSMNLEVGNTIFDLENLPQHSRRINIGDMEGYLETSGGGGCGSFTYFFNTPSKKSITVTSPYIFREMWPQKALEHQPEKWFMNKILSTLIFIKK